MIAGSPGDEVVKRDEGSFRVGYTSEGVFVAEWPGEARLVREQGAWRFEPVGDLAPARAEKLARGAARAVERYCSGQMSLHASAVALGRQAIVVLGSSGAGKSTTAASICALDEASLLADDVLAVESTATGLIALPTEGIHWITTSADTSKQPRPARHQATLAVRVAAIVVLDVNESPSLVQPTRLKGHAAMLALSSAHITLPIATREDRTRDFIWLANVCQHAPIFRLRRRCGGDPNEVACAALRLLDDLKT